MRIALTHIYGFTQKKRSKTSNKSEQEWKSEKNDLRVVYRYSLCFFIVSPCVYFHSQLLNGLLLSIGIHLFLYMLDTNCAPEELKLLIVPLERNKTAIQELHWKCLRRSISISIIWKSTFISRSVFFCVAIFSLSNSLFLCGRAIGIIFSILKYYS